MYDIFQSYEPYCFENIENLSKKTRQIAQDWGTFLYIGVEAFMTFLLAEARQDPKTKEMRK